MRASGAPRLVNVSASGVHEPLLQPQHARHQRRLARVDRQLRPARRRQADEVQPRRPALRQHAPGRAQRHAVLPLQQAVVEERELDAVAGAPHDGVELSLRPSANSTPRPLALRTPGATAMRPWWIQCSSCELTTGFWSVRRQVAGAGSPYSCGPADGDPDHRPQRVVLQPRRQPHDPQLAARLAGERLRLEQVALADRDRRREPQLLRAVDGDVAARVARPDHQHPRALDVGGATGRRPRAAGGPCSPAAPAAAAPAGGRSPPPRPRTAASRRRWSRPASRGASGAMRSTRVSNVTWRTRSRVGRVAQQVVAHLVAARVQRIGGRHRVAGEPGAVTRRDQVQRLVAGVPLAADAVGRLEAVELEAGLVQGVDGREAGGAGADDAVPGCSSAEHEAAARDWTRVMPPCTRRRSGSRCR